MNKSIIKKHSPFYYLLAIIIIIIIISTETSVKEIPICDFNLVLVYTFIPTWSISLRAYLRIDAIDLSHSP